MQCSNCQTQLTESADVCPQCGARVRPDIQVSQNITTFEPGGLAVGAVTGGTVIARDQITIQIVYQREPFVLQQPDLVHLRQDYVAYLQETYARLDFRGTGLIEAVEKASGLTLESVYVPLRARPEMPEGETWLRIAGRMWQGDAAPSEADNVQHERALRAAESVPVQEALNHVPALVLLGDPGSGKSTLLKVLALGLARQPGAPLPILVPLNAYAEALEHESISLHDFLPHYFAARQGQLRNVALLFEAALAQGQAVVLLDGLDEVQARREYLVGLVEDFVREHIPAPARRKAQSLPPGNRVVVTSRFVGYRQSPLADARWQTFALVDWERDEIEHFVQRWTLAVELAVAGGCDSDTVRRKAEQEQRELDEAIFSHVSIERLAGNEGFDIKVHASLIALWHTQALVN